MDQMVNEYKRLDYIDAAKAFGMMAVMWGHIHFNDISNDFVYAFHIPLFFALSGMVFFPEKYGGFKNFVVRKVKSLLVPYAIYSVATWIIWAVYVWMTHQQVDSIWAPLLETVIARGSEGYLVHNVPLWFVTCLFVVELTYYWISKLPDWLNIMVDVLLAFFGYVLVTYVKFFDFTTLPWSIEVGMMAMLFFAVGHLVVKRIGHDKIVATITNRPWLYSSIAILLFIGVYIVASNNGNPSMGHARLNNPLLFYPGAFMGIAAMVIMCVVLNNLPTNNKLWRWVLWFGSNSFIAMAIHVPIKGFLIAIAVELLDITPYAVKTSVSLGIVIWIITLAITATLMIFIVRFKKRLSRRKSE
jgi:fucose 4-O-acetylase-like acetyltransferase